VQQGVVTVSQEDRIILEGEKCGGIYKLKEENLVRGGVSGISFEGSYHEVELERRLQRDMNRVKVFQKRERVHLGEAQDGPKYGVNQSKALGRGARVKSFTIWLQSRKELK